MGIFQSDREKAALQNAATRKMAAEDKRYIEQQKINLMKEKERNRHTEAMQKIDNDKIKLENENLKLKIQLMKLSEKQNQTPNFGNYFSKGSTSEDQEALIRRVMEMEGK